MGNSESLTMPDFTQIQTDYYRDLADLEQRFNDRRDAMEELGRQRDEEYIARLTRQFGFDEDYWRNELAGIKHDIKETIETDPATQNMLRDIHAFATGSRPTVPSFVEYTRYKSAPLWEQYSEQMIPCLNKFLDDARKLNASMAAKANDNTINTEMAARGLLDISYATETDVQITDAVSDISKQTDFLTEFSKTIGVIIVDTADIPVILDFVEYDRYTDGITALLGDTFTPEIVRCWPSMSIEQRAQTLDVFVNRFGSDKGVNILGIHVGDLLGAAGRNNGNGILILDYHDLQDPDRLGEILKTIINEARHQFQRDAIATPGKFDISQDTLDKWATNFNNYIYPEDDLEGYMNQLVEADAYAVVKSALGKFLSTLK